MNIFTFDQVYNLVRAQAVAQNTEDATNYGSDWRDYYPDVDEIDELIDKLPNNNTFEQDIKNAASLLQEDFDDLHKSSESDDEDDTFLFSDDEDDIIEELNAQHRSIEVKIPQFLNKYIK